jgi:hypothetical protein
MNWFMRQRFAAAWLAGLAGLVVSTLLARGQLWETATPAPLTYTNENYGTSWQCLACSADGLTLVGVINPVLPDSYSIEPVGGAGPSPPGQPPPPELPTLLVSTNAGATWITNAPPDNWQAVASSADGKNLVAAATVGFIPTQLQGPIFSFVDDVEGDGLIYTSDDSGMNWYLEGAPNNTWFCVASSADGSRLFAAATKSQPSSTGLSISGDGLIYVRNCGGAWQPTAAPSADWISIASSADGTRVTAAAAGYWTWNSNINNNVLVGGPIYTSTNSGVSWMLSNTPSNDWSAIACSMDGTILVAAASYNSIYVSTNAGISWIQTSAPTNVYTSVACSANGTHLFAATIDRRRTGTGGLIYRSDDGGVSWTSTTLPYIPWKAVACSADGYRASVASGAPSGGTDRLLCTFPYRGAWRLAESPPGVSIVASSADGQIFATAGNQQVYLSTNSGLNWKQSSAPSNDWSALAISAAGTRLVALDEGHWDTNSATWMGGGIYRSLDSGASWSRTGAPNAGWGAVAYSPDGNTLFAADAGGLDAAGYHTGSGGIYRSSDSGMSWQETGAPIREWTSIAASTDNTKLVAGSNEGEVYLSTDSGVSWTQAKLPTNSWLAVAISADGSKLVADTVQAIYTSLDSGASWQQSLFVPWGPGNFWVDTRWNHVLASSADCSKLFTAIGGAIYESNDFGATWALSDMPAGYGYGWQEAASSSDGNKVVAVGGSIAVLRQPPPPPPAPPSPQLSIYRSSASLVLSWLMPSTRFVLQRSFDLASGEWVDVTDQPTFNFSNLHNELTLPPPSGNTFYRLKQR